MGLSPRVRGHPRRGCHLGARCGTIPAGAGTPNRFSGHGPANRDYPRGCGDTMMGAATAIGTGGLSPRVRGHLAPAPAGRSSAGTIPAGAGTPTVRYYLEPQQRDYPRGCGDTLWERRGKPGGRGLSPRVRGHRRAKLAYRRNRGTIPAGAGTPLACLSSYHPSRDYPRGCGDTKFRLPSIDGTTGLSPRVRGHPRTSQAGPARRGTIPAGAGTPFSVT